MANTYDLCKLLWERHPFLSQYFELDRENKRLIRKYEHPKGLNKIYQQYLYYRWRFQGDVLFFQVGKFFEFYYARDREIANWLGLSQIRKNQRGARYGFPVNLMHRYIERLIKRKVSITLILEKERYWTGIKQRIPAWRFETVVG
jgi:hypothetical protein